MPQRPTMTGIRVRSTRDCNVIFHAVSLGILPLVSRRLSIEERRAIHSGCIFVWEERSPTLEAAADGLERWTDSRRWGASRLTKDFLFYQEKLPDVGDPALFAAMYQNRLVKQTYSVYVETAEGRRKWHLVAYCSPETGQHLLTVDDVPELASIRHRVPEHKYQPARYSKTRQRPDTEAEDAHTSRAPLDFSTLSPPPGSSSPYTPESYLAPAHQPSLSHDAFGAVPQHALWLPKAPPLPRRDPDWVLHKHVAFFPDVDEVQRRRVLGRGASKDKMAPLVYVRPSPYRVRHPLDNEALRSFDSVP